MSLTPGFAAIDRAVKESAPAGIELDPSSVLNMETSFLAFQARVLELARDPDVPPLERLRFVSIFGDNLDEFFMTRVAGFQRQLAVGSRKRTLDGLLPEEQLERIRARTRELIRFAHHEALGPLLAELGEHGVALLGWDELPDPDRRYLCAHYGAHLRALFTQLALDPLRPFPQCRNLRPALAVHLREEDGDDRFAVIELPGEAPALVPLPGGLRFVPMEEVIRAQLPQLFPGHEVVSARLFRITRIGNLSLDPDVDDVVEAVADNVALRPYEPVVRLEVDAAMPPGIRDSILEELASHAEIQSSRLTEEDVFLIDGLIDLRRLERMADLPISELRYPPLRRKTPLPPGETVFERVSRGEVLCRFPAHSFRATVERFLEEAADDPFVEEIRITLYRTDRTSRVVRLLRRAHRRGKRVVVFIEVKASFEERRNIEWARSLEAAGIQVLYGPGSIKVHAKIAVVVRREGDERRVYSYLGTGNLNAVTTSTYTDLALMTSDQAIGEELVDVFEMVADQPARARYQELLVAPVNMRRRFGELIEREIGHARAGRGAGIAAKMNGLADRGMLAALYDASRAGVTIALSVRSICSLRPGVPGLSENIRVVSILGRFLEHSRIFRFENGGEREYYIGSADWRGRNLGRRVEVVVPVRAAAHRAVLDRLLERDLTAPKGWELGPDGSYARAGGEGPRGEG